MRVKRIDRSTADDWDRWTFALFRQHRKMLDQRPPLSYMSTPWVAREISSKRYE